VTTDPTPLQPARLSRLAALALLWGSNFLWIKLALRGFAPAQLVFVRLALGALVLTVFLRARGDHLPRGRAVWAHLTLAAIFACVVPYLLFAYGEQRVDSSIAGLLNATTPLWTALIAMLLLKYMQLRAQFAWSLSNLVALLRMNLFTHRDLWAWLEQPFEGPPEPGPAAEQAVLNLG